MEVNNEHMATIKLSLQEKVGKMCVIGVPSLEAGKSFQGRQQAYGFGGVGIFPHNINNELQVTQLVAKFHELHESRNEPSPYYISVDEEGGSLSNFKAFYPYIPGNRAIASSGDPEAAYMQGQIIGSQLHALGIPMDWAPVLDVNTNINNPVIGVRSYGEDPETVGKYGQAFIRGMHEAGVAVTAKHFPGHGQVSGDSHYVLPECPLTLEELGKGPLLPFVAAIKSGVDSIMMGHLVFPNIPESQGLPASLSPFFVHGLLRGQLGYEGVICTDDVEMGAIKDNYSPEEIGIMAVKAGVDQILMCHTPEFQERVVAGIVGAIERGELSEEQIDQSIARIRRLHQSFERYQLEAKPLPREEWESESLKLAIRTVVVERDPQGLLPMSKNHRYLLILPKQEKLTVADNTSDSELILARLLDEAGFEVHLSTCSLDPQIEEITALTEQSQDYDCIIQGTLNAHLFGGQTTLAQQLQDTRKPILHLVLRNPYDVDCLSKDAGVVMVGSTSDYSIKALTRILAGEA
ncbi:glycoside hydrolase family 3 protein [Paenibacillus antibioticophila]|uniref:glycoside hydrolase family 3 protein n=1 Tax=Paenibacillus antibioticophila TaxID=1274374 RepID=UPI0005CA40F7|nr:glycoside hydrolase family 3 protein [Paenibacillus antibioticophila]